MRSGLKAGLKGNNFSGNIANGCLSQFSKRKYKDIIIASDSFQGLNGDSINGRFTDGRGFSKNPNYLYQTGESSGLALAGAGKQWTSPKGYISVASGVDGMRNNTSIITLGDNVISNPSFDDSSAWNITDPTNVTISGGALNFNGSQSGTGKGANQSCLTVGTMYKFVMDVTRTAGQITHACGLGTSYLSTGVATMYKLAYSTSLTIYSNTSPNVFSGTVNSIYAYPMTFSECFHTLKTSESNVAISSSLYPSTNQTSGIVVNLDSETNPQNFVMVHSDSGGIICLTKCVNGTYTTLINSYLSAYSDYSNVGDIILYKTGNKYTVFYNYKGILYPIGTPQTINDESIINNTIHGIICPGNAYIISRFILAKYRGQQYGSII